LFERALSAAESAPSAVVRLLALPITSFDAHQVADRWIEAKSVNNLSQKG
jgi:hypothetical protein